MHCERITLVSCSYNLYSSFQKVDSEFQKAGIVYEVTAFIGIQKQAKIKVPRNKKAVYVNGIMEI